MTETLLDITGLNVEFETAQGQVYALRNINLKVPKGKILGVVGESGSGKSTLIWTIMRLLAKNSTVRSGTVKFQETDVLSYNSDELREFRGENVSIVFQDPMTSQIPVLDYRTQMRDILYRRSNLSNQEKVKASVRMMSQVGIADAEERIKHYPHQFSGGMRQRAGIAMALLMDPVMLIADEPTTALDVTMEAQIIHLLREARSEFNSTILLVSHNLGLVAELCDEVVVMYAGEIVEHAGINDIFFNSKHPYTQALLECNPALELRQIRQFATISGDVPDLHRPPLGCVFATRCHHAQDPCAVENPRQLSIPSDDSNVTHKVRCHLHDHEYSVHFQQPQTQFTQSSKSQPTDWQSNAQQSLQPLLNIDELRIRYPTMGKVRAFIKGNTDPYVDAVLNATLTVHKGETLGLVGESGSGKTSLGSAILGLNKIHSGSIRFKDEEIVGLSQRQYKRFRRHIAMMFQDPVGSLSPRRTVEQILIEPFKIHGIANKSLEAEVRRLCDMVSLPTNFLSRYPHELSGGQARRVGVARALALNPALIVADEPTAGLDVSVQGEILNLMIEMQTTHELGYLIISHNLPVVRQFSDKLAIMYLGRIVEQGDCELVFSTPAHPYSEALVNGTPNPDPTRRRDLVSIEGEVPSLTNRPSGCEFHPRCAYARDICKEKSPSNVNLTNGRKVRCHFPLAA